MAPTMETTDTYDRPSPETVTEFKKANEEMDDTQAACGGSVPVISKKKRAPRGGKKLAEQEITDFVPVGGSFGQPAIPMEDANAEDFASELPTQKEMRSDDHTTATRLALTRLEGFRERLSGLNPHEDHPAYIFAQKEVHNAEVDYYYCQYYPVGREWRLPPNPNKRHLKESKKMRPAIQWRSQLWKLVEKSMENSTLEQIRNGNLVSTDITSMISDSIPSSEPGPTHLAHTTDGIEDRKLMKTSTPPYDDLTSTSASPEHMTINVDEERILATEEAEALMHIKQEDEEMYGPQVTHNAPRSLIDLESDTEEKVKARRTAAESGAADTITNHSDRGGRLLSDLSSEELKKQSLYFCLGADVDLSLPAKCLICAGIHSVDACAMACSHCGAFNQHLPELCPTKVKCPKCRESGHEEPSCPYKLKTLALDEIICDLCDRSGHVEEECELIWRTSGKPWEFDFKLPYVQLYCYECGKKGHLGNDCSTRRPGKGLGTSTWSAHQNFDVPTIPEHSNELPASRPKRQLTKNRRGKGQVGPKGLVPTEPKGPRGPAVGEQFMMERKRSRGVEMKIKGMAMSEPADDFSEQISFLHPKKLPEPARTGKIKINTGGSHRVGQAPSTQFPSINRPFGDYGPEKPSYPISQKPPYGGGAGRARYHHGNPMNDGKHRRGGRQRSISPPRMPRNGDYRGDRYEPGPPPPARDYGNKNEHGPARGAADHAYSRQRR